MGREMCEPGRERLNRIRAGFVSQGTTLTAWCNSQGLHRGNVYKALLHEWRGPKAAMLEELVVRASQVETE